MNLFGDKDGKFKRLEKIILDIEKEKHTISWAHTTIQSCLWNLEKSPNLQKFDLEMIAKDLRENLNKKEEAQAKIQDLQFGTLKAEMEILKLGSQTYALLRQVEDIKKFHVIDATSVLQATSEEEMKSLTVDLYKSDDVADWKVEAKFPYFMSRNPIEYLAVYFPIDHARHRIITKTGKEISMATKQIREDCLTQLKVQMYS